jgi:hypothetical protein
VLTILLSLPAIPVPPFCEGAFALFCDGASSLTLVDSAAAFAGILPALVAADVVVASFFFIDPTELTGDGVADSAFPAASPAALFGPHFGAALSAESFADLAPQAGTGGGFFFADPSISGKSAVASNLGSASFFEAPPKVPAALDPGPFAPVARIVGSLCGVD